MLLWKLSIILVFFSVVEYVKCGEANFFNSIYIRWENQGNQTRFWLNAYIPGLFANETANLWIGVGINDIDEMDNLNCVICQIFGFGSFSTIRHYGAEKVSPKLFDMNNPGIGLSEANMTTTINSNNERNITCTFKRDNIKSASLVPTSGTRYIEIGPNSNFYVMTAFGAESLGYHGPNNRAVTKTLQSFQVGDNSSSGSSTLMTFVQSIWQFFMSIFDNIFKRS